MTGLIGLSILVVVVLAVISAADLRDRRRPPVPVNRQRLERIECARRNNADRAMP